MEWRDSLEYLAEHFGLSKEDVERLCSGVAIVFTCPVEEEY